MTMAPLVVDGKVYVGNSGGEMGVAGWLAALDVNTGKELWRAYSVGPDSMVRIGADFKPFYSWLRGKDLGETHVAGGRVEARRRRGVGMGHLRSRPASRSIYGTSNTGPWNADQRPGLNLWTSGVFARNADDGMAQLGVRLHAAQRVGLRRRQREHPRRPPDQRADAQGDGAVQSQRLRLHDRPHDRRGARREAVRPRELGVAASTRRRRCRSSSRRSTPCRRDAGCATSARPTSA